MSTKPVRRSWLEERFELVDLLKDTLDAIHSARELFQDGESEEITASRVRKARNSIEEITGHSTDEEILDRIFSKFCIGK